jgi:hypothetical protein
VLQPATLVAARASRRSAGGDLQPEAVARYVQVPEAVGQPLGVLLLVALDGRMKSFWGSGLY